MKGKKQTNPFHTVSLINEIRKCVSIFKNLKLTGVICPNSLILLKVATYGASVSSGLSVADPKYFLPAALATRASPALDVPVGKAPDDVDVVLAVVVALDVVFVLDAVVPEPEPYVSFKATVSD